MSDEKRIAYIKLGKIHPKERHKIEILNGNKVESEIYLDEILVGVPVLFIGEEHVPIVELAKVRAHARAIREALEYFKKADEGVERDWHKNAAEEKP